MSVEAMFGLIENKGKENKIRKEMFSNVWFERECLAIFESL